MGNGSSSSSSSQQERRRAGGEEHTYEEIQEQDRRERRENNRFNRNCSIVTLDIKPGEWRRFAEAQKSKEEDGAGGRDLWWGDYDQGSQRRSGTEEEKNSRAARCQEGGWDTLDNAGWRDEAVGPWATSYKTYKRCVSLDVKQIDPDLDEKSDF